jgi:hypothetical protein
MECVEGPRAIFNDIDTVYPIFFFTTLFRIRLYYYLSIVIMTHYAKYLCPYKGFGFFIFGAHFRHNKLLWKSLYSLLGIELLRLQKLKICMKKLICPFRVLLKIYWVFFFYSTSHSWVACFLFFHSQYFVYREFWIEIWYVSDFEFIS